MAAALERERDEGTSGVVHQAGILTYAVHEFPGPSDDVEILPHPEHVDHAADHAPHCAANDALQIGSNDTFRPGLRQVRMAFPSCVPGWLSGLSTEWSVRE